MNETPFYKTRMGHTYYEHTMPELVRQLERLNELLEKLIGLDQAADNQRAEDR